MRAPVAVALKIAHKNYGNLQEFTYIPHTPALSCLVRLEYIEDVTSGNIWPQFVHEKKLRVSHLKEKEVAYLMGGRVNKSGGVSQEGGWARPGLCEIYAAEDPPYCSM